MKTSGRFWEAKAGQMGGFEAKLGVFYGKLKGTKVGRDLYAIFELHIRYSRILVRGS